MKRFWLVMIALGMVVSFSAPVLAADVKFSGSYYAAGLYQDEVTFAKGGSLDGTSTAFYYQRLRIQMEFIASPALKLVTRFDALERSWGAPRSAPGGGFPIYGDSAGDEAENENIAFDWAYIQYASPIGVFTVGYQPDGGWGTVFADNEVNAFPVGKIGWALTRGGFTGRLQIVKLLELNKTAKFTYTPFDVQDADIDKYSGDIKYAWNSGEAGLRGFYLRSASLRVLGIKSEYYGLIPYAKAKFGPVTVQAEVDYYWGKMIEWEPGLLPPLTPDIKLENLGVFVDATADFGMFYVGLTGAYVSGDDYGTQEKMEGGLLTGGVDWNPCLILWNYERTKWAGYINSYIDGNGSPMENAWFGQLRGGVRPITDLDIMASVSYALADEKFSYTGGPHDSDEYGLEIDITATYRITNNLNYMIGAGYLFTGDYYRGAVGYSYGDVTDNFIMINKLTYTF